MDVGTQPNGQDYVTTIAMGVLAFAGAISKGKQWRDSATGKVNVGVLVAGIATSLVLTAIVRAIGIHYGLEIWAQLALAGVFGYIGPDPIIGAISKFLFKRFGLEDKDDDRGAGPK